MHASFENKNKNKKQTKTKQKNHQKTKDNPKDQNQNKKNPNQQNKPTDKQIQANKNLTIIENYAACQILHVVSAKFRFFKNGNF